MDLISLIFGAIFINNIVLSKFLGVCPLLGVSKKSSSAVGMGLAVTFVIFAASLISYFLYYYVLVPNNIEYMETISFILVIASFVQIVEMAIKKFSAPLYESLGVYLPLITTNCTVLYVAQQNITAGYDLLHTIIYSLAVPIGFMMTLYLFACLRERLDSANTSKSWKGNPIALVTAALMALAFMGLSGIV